MGAITLALAQQVGATGRVVAIEAAPPNMTRLQANLDLNPHLKERVTPLNQGAGAAKATLYWTEEAANPGNGSLGSLGELRVSVVTVDDVVAAEKLTRVDFMKVDVEGMELAVFEGARETLARYKPMLYFETLGRFKAASGAGNFDKITSLLGGQGYRLYDIGEGGSIKEKTAERLGDYTVATFLPHPPRA